MSRLHETEELSAEVVKWAKDIGAQAVVTQEEIKYTCKGSMKQIWNFLVKHVRSKRNAELIRSNLKLDQPHDSFHQAKSSGDAASENSLAELQSCHEKSRAISFEIHTMIQKIGEKEGDVHSRREATAQLQRRAVFLEACCHKLDLDSQLLREYQRQMAALLTVAVDAHQGSAVVSGGVAADGTRVLVSETESQRAARLSCEDIAAKLESAVLNGD